MNNDVPLIWTSKGNVPVDSLAYQARWEITDKFVKLIEVYHDSTGELVKENAHVCVLQGEFALPEYNL